MMDGGPIDAYLDALQGRLWLPPSRVRRIIAEAEDHLRESAARWIADGLREVDAEARAVAAFGSPPEVARRFAREAGLTVAPSLLAELALACALLLGAALMAIGTSGLIAEAMGRVFGAAFVAADAPGVTYTPERCAEYLRVSPGASSCEAAATEDHLGELTQLRAVLAVPGLVALLGTFAAQRSYRRRVGVRLVPAGLTPAVGAAMFGSAAALFGGAGVLELAHRPAGSGALLSSGLGALVVAAAFAHRLFRALRLA